MSEGGRVPERAGSGPILSRRAFSLALGLGIAGFADGCSGPARPGQSAGQSNSPPTSSPPGSTGQSYVPPIGPTVLPTVVASPVKGRLLIVRNGNLEDFDLGTLRAAPLTHYPRGTYAASPTLSPDRKRIAFTLYTAPRDRQDLGGNDLYVVDASGSNARLLRPHPGSGASFESPCWTADRKAVLATFRQPLGTATEPAGESVTIVRCGLEGSPPAPFVANALGPATSPDGKLLVYTALDAQGQPGGLRIADGDGRNPRPLLVGEPFAYILGPSFSPDSARIVFSAVGGPGTSAPVGATGWLPPGVSVAEAHGIPWDIWSVRSNGTDLQRLTHEGEDSPLATWSPDGKWIAIAGEIALYLVDADGKGLVSVSTLQSGGIAWLS